MGLDNPEPSASAQVHVTKAKGVYHSHKSLCSKSLELKSEKLLSESVVCTSACMVRVKRPHLLGLPVMNGKSKERMRGELRLNSCLASM